MGYKDWETPPEFFEAMDDEFHFNYDAAASHKNRLCKRYSTVDGTFVANFNHGLDIWDLKVSDADGLNVSWYNCTTWCNPPYDSTIPQWLSKAVESILSVYLLPPSIDTAWFHNTLWDASAHHPRTHWEIRFLTKRLKFLKDGKVGPAPRAGNLVAIYRS